MLIQSHTEVKIICGENMSGKMNYTLKKYHLITTWIPFYLL